MPNVKQLIIVRNDLRSKLRSGKLAAQVAHASMASFLYDREIERNAFDDGNVLTLDLSTPADLWINGSFTKIVLKCDDEDHLLSLRDTCMDSNIPHYLVQDAGRTVFREPTHTCLGVGPYWSNSLDKLFKHLTMY